MSDESIDELVIESDDVERLKTPQHMEYKAYAAFASELMTGIDIGGKYLQIHVNNRPQSAADAAKFKIDAVITLDRVQIGVIDIERKPQWNGGPWPYKKINIPYRPCDVFYDGASSAGRLSSKARELMRAYKEKQLGFWVGYSSPIADAGGQACFVSRQSCMVVPADRIFEAGAIGKQPTRYGREVDVIHVENSDGIACYSEKDFTSLIVERVKAWAAQQEAKS